jgi:signal transduction histidine kinase
MALRNAFSIDSSLRGRRWQTPIVLPVVLALALVIALAVQSIRATQMHRRAVANALRDYATFATWQYTRRASDYLRLTIGAQLEMRSFLPPGAIDARSRISCRFRGDVPTATHNETSNPTTTIEAGLAEAVRRADRSHQLIGITPFGTAKNPLYLGYRFRRDSAGWSSCEAIVVDAAALLPVFNHVAGYAPLLPPTFVANLPNDSLVSIQVFDPRGERIATVGAQSPGMSASDVLGPDLADLRVVATLHPAATERLVAGGMPASNATALVGMLVVAVILCGVAVVQLRRTQEVIRLRDDFVASVSHELKTPLTQISLFADTLASPRDRSAEERRRYLTIISREAARLGHLVDGILHFAGMTRSPSANTAREPSMLGEEIRAAVAAFEPLAEARNVAISVRIENEIDLPLDRDAFRQVMLNVLDNSLKFGPDGQQIAIRAGSSGANAVITIDDEGPGVPEDERERAFEAFVRVERSGAKTGSGIGLAVVREVVRRHGGSVRLDSSPTGGTRVEIRLPATHVMTADALATLG